MLVCSACMRRAFSSPVAATSNLPLRPILFSFPAPDPAKISSRSHATFQSIQKGHHRQDLYKALKKKKLVAASNSKAASPRAKSLSKDRQAREHNRLQRLTDAGRAEYLQNAMTQEARFLVDPLKLAQAVVEKLRDSDLEAALQLVRASEKARDGMPVDNIVSWNHIIDWLMSQKSPSDAWKVYNEMKKRGHKPDAHTFTILLRGYRDNVKKPNAVRQAVDVYNSIYAPNSAVTPTTIHTNAVLSVCARANDIDALWSIAGRLPERGPGAPDHATFTTILQALSADARNRAVKLSSLNGPGYDPQSIFDQVIDDARKLWVDITARWRRGEIQLDEALVCAMGRLLMLSRDAKAHEDILNLVQQTMNIAKDPGVAGRAQTDAGEDTEDLAITDDKVDFASTSLVPTGSLLSQVNKSTSSVYTAPGRNTLSMLIETTTALRHLRLGKHYWDLLTAADGPYKIVPDAQNVTAYLRLLRVSRASQAGLDLLRTPRPKDVQNELMVRGTFVIAMSTCLRDKNNPNVFETASRIMDLMQGSEEGLDVQESEAGTGRKLRFSPKVLVMYLELAMATTKGIGGAYLVKTKDGDLDFERDPHKNNTFRALSRLRPDVVNVRHLIKSHLVELEQQAAARERTISVKKLLAKRQVTPYSVNENMGDLVQVLQTMVSAYDKILMVNEKLEDDGMGPLDKDLLTDCWAQKRKLSAFVTKLRGASVVPSEIRERRPRDMKSYSSPRRDPRGGENAEAGLTEDLADDEDPDMTSYSERTQVMEDIASEQARRSKAREEKRLSRIQKMELRKEEEIRAQFPARVLRAKKQDEKREKDRERRLRAAQRRDTRAARSAKSKDYSGWGDRFGATTRADGHDENANIVEVRP